MPETYGKRQRSAVKARKAAAREDRRLARNRRKEGRQAGLPENTPGEGPPETLEGPEEAAQESAAPDSRAQA